MENKISDVFIVIMTAIGVVTTLSGLVIGAAYVVAHLRWVP